MIQKEKERVAVLHHLTLGALEEMVSHSQTQIRAGWVLK